MILQEAVKSFLKQAPEDKKISSEIPDENTLIDLSNDEYQTVGSFFDDTEQSMFGGTTKTDIIFKQKEKIQKYRQLAMQTDVTDGIDEIVNEIIFSYDDTIPLIIDIDEENDKLVEAITRSFEKILNQIDIRKNLFNIVKRSYVDGQMKFHLAYDQKSTKNGIKEIKMIDPTLFYYDKKERVYKYMTQETGTGLVKTSDVFYSPEEIVSEDFGLYDGKIVLSYLEYAIKPANMLKTLEDLLVPLRFSRSISRRVFNVDIGDLPAKRGSEVMQDHQRKFKYKKFYNNETGEVSNQQHITSMVEDYWFANRSGGKGTTVDLLDETGNLGELDDIIYFNKKLYRSMKIPSNRVSVDPDGDKDFEFDSTRVTKEDMKFFMFVSRLRQVYSSVFKEILKREVVSTGVMKESEWDDKEHSISIKFTNENKFIEKMKLDNFMSKLDIYSTAQEYQGKLFSVTKILKEIFRYSDEDIEEMFKEIKEEETNDLFSKFYSDGEDGGGSW